MMELLHKNVTNANVVLELIPNSETTKSWFMSGSSVRSVDRKFAIISCSKGIGPQCMESSPKMPISVNFVQCFSPSVHLYISMSNQNIKPIMFKQTIKLQTNNVWWILGIAKLAPYGHARRTKCPNLRSNNKQTMFEQENISASC